jgi:hypothetical protein
LALQLQIAGVDRTSRVLFPSLQATQNLTSQVDTLALQLRLPGGASSEIPSANQEIQLLDGADKLFAGKIVSPPRALIANTSEVLVSVMAQDYQFDLTRRLAVEAYQNQTAGAIIRDLISKYASAYGITAGTIEDGPVLEAYPINYEPLADAIERLAKLVGFDWYVDYGKALHFYSPTGSASVAPWDLTEDATSPYLASAPYDSFAFNEDITQLRNIVTVRGAETASDIVTQKITATGVERNFILNLGQVVKGTLTMTIDGVAQTVGEEGKVDASTVDWLVNYKNRSVQATSGTTTPANGVVIEFQYRYLTQIVVQARDAPSITDFGEFEHVVVNPEITSRALAVQVAKAELRHFGQPAATASYRTTRPGLRAGMRQRITIPRLSVDGLFLLRSVTLSTPARLAQATDFQGVGYFRRWSVQAQRIGD